MAKALILPCSLALQQCHKKNKIPFEYPCQLRKIVQIKTLSDDLLQGLSPIMEQNSLMSWELCSHKTDFVFLSTCIVQYTIYLG